MEIIILISVSTIFFFTTLQPFMESGSMIKMSVLELAGWLTGKFCFIYYFNLINVNFAFYTVVYMWFKVKSSQT